MSELQLHGGDVAACGFSPYSFPHALPENPWQAWSLQGDPKGLVRGWLGHERRRHMFKLFWSKGSTVLFRDQQQPQKTELQWCLLAVNRKSQVTCQAPCTALWGILWHLGGMGLPHWGFFVCFFFLWKIMCFRKKFCYPGRSEKRWVRIWKLTGWFQIFIIPLLYPDIIMRLWTWMAFIPKGCMISMDILHFFKTCLV